MQTNLKSRPEEIEAHKVTVGINIEQVWKDTAREKLSRLFIDLFPVPLRLQRFGRFGGSTPPPDDTAVTNLM